MITYMGVVVGVLTTANPYDFCKEFLSNLVKNYSYLLDSAGDIQVDGVHFADVKFRTIDGFVMGIFTLYNGHTIHSIVEA